MLLLLLVVVVMVMVVVVVVRMLYVVRAEVWVVRWRCCFVVAAAGGWVSGGWAGASA
jgi:hypothetical protein